MGGSWEVGKAVPGKLRVPQAGETPTPLGSAANVAPHSRRSSASLEPPKGDLGKLEPFCDSIKTHSVSDLRTDVEKPRVWTLTILAGRDYSAKRRIDTILIVR